MHLILCVLELHINKRICNELQKVSETQRSYLAAVRILPGFGSV